MNHSGGAPVRQPVQDLPDAEFTQSHSEDTGESSKRTLARLQVLWASRRVLWRAGLYAAFASTLIALLIPARYESTARLMPPDNQSNSGLAMAAAAMSGAAGGLGAGGLAGIASDLLGLKSTSEVFVGVLGSRTVQDKLIQEFDLKKVYWDRRMEDARDDLAAHTAISVDRKSQIITIKVTDKNPRRAAAMAEAYVAELNRLVAELSTSSARRERIFLEGRLQGVNQDLEVAEKDFSQFASANTAIDVKEQGKAMVEAAAMLQGQLIAAQSQYEGLREIYTDNNTRVVSLRARIDELQRQLEKLGGKGESSTDPMARPNDSMYPSIRKLPLLGVKYGDLYRRAKIQEVVLEALTKEYELAKVQEAKEIPTVKVLDQANVPEKRSFPPRALIAFFGTAFALAVAAAFILQSKKWEETDANDPRKIFAQEVFSTIAAHILGQNGSGGNSANGRRWHWAGGHSDAEREEKADK